MHSQESEQMIKKIIVSCNSRDENIFEWGGGWEDQLC